MARLARHAMPDKARLLGWQGSMPPGFGPYIHLSEYEKPGELPLYKRLFNDKIS